MIRDCIPFLKFVAKLCFFLALITLCQKYLFASSAFLYNMGTIALWGTCLCVIATDIIGFVCWIPNYSKRQVYKNWMGKYFAFREHPVKFFMDDEHDIWVQVKHVSPLLNPPISKGELELALHRQAIANNKDGSLIKQSELSQLIARRLDKLAPDHQQVLLQRWLDTEVYPNLKRHQTSSFKL